MADDASEPSIQQHILTFLGIIAVDAKAVFIKGPIITCPNCGHAETVAPSCFISARLCVSGPRCGIGGAPLLGNSGPPSALNRISNDQNVNDVFAGEALE